MSAYDSAKDVFFVRTWRCAGESIGRKMKADSATSNTLNHNIDHIKSLGNTALSIIDGDDRRNWDQAKVANVSILTSVDELIGTTWADSWKFAVVRNPYSIVYSEWKVINRHYNAVNELYGMSNVSSQPRPAGMTDDELVEICKDFNKFVTAKYGIENETDYEFMGVSRFGLAGCLYHANGALGVNEVLYYEDLNNEWNTKVASPKGFSNTVNIVTNNFPKGNITGTFKDTEWTSAYNSNSINLVANAYCADLELFGYSFSDGLNKPTGHTIPVKTDPTPSGPWQGRSAPGKRFSSAGGRDYGDKDDSVTSYFKNRINFAIKEEAGN